MRRLIALATASGLALMGVAGLYAQQVPSDPAGQGSGATAAGIDLGTIEKRVSQVADQAAALVAGARVKLDGAPDATASASAFVEDSRAKLGDANLTGMNGIDPADLSKLAANAHAPTSSDTGPGVHPGLMAFVSLSMPKEALRQTIIDMGKAGGIVVFRGFPGNSMAAFKTRLAEAIGSDLHPHNVGIDPRLFEAFAVTSVPTYVAEPQRFALCGKLDCTGSVPDFDVLRGNVPVSYALETFAHGSGAGADLARAGLAQLEAQ